ncbi:MAG: SDR family oxidoreductase [Gammaproteobacteria bacterium]|nr:SDR family oxidoreductase [Gammaproteobacteria bacterium]
MSKLVLVTGASRGIGKAVFLKLLSMGHRVIGTASTEKSSQLILDGVENHDQCFALYGDLNNPKTTMAHWADAINEKFKEMPSAIISNAGITRDNLMLRMTDDQWHDVVQVNLNANYYLVKTFLKPMVKARTGKFVFLGSVSSHGNPGQSNYAATKAAICGLSRSIALEYGARNITSNVISPGFIETDMTNELTLDQQKSITDRIPLKRYGQVDDVANLASFLISNESNYITGQTIHINGGMRTT